ncbi:MAG TPA: FHA domain-containing protein [Holophagaceae bacterium]|nr:FHA domain-containing protein [Holophagaceae bacterium]
MAKLLVQESGAEPREFDLVDAEVHIGRELDNALRIPDPSISRHHCVIRKSATGFEIQDLQSSNGVLLNGNRVQSSPLKHGDRVTLGQIHLTFMDPGAEEGATVAIQAMGAENPAGTVRMSADQMAALHGGAPAPAAAPTPAPERPTSTAIAPPAPPAPPPAAPLAPQFGHFTDPGAAGSQGAPMSGGEKPFHDEDKIFLFLAYFGLLALVPFLMFKDKREDPQKEFVYWHARQGLTLAIVVIVLIVPTVVIMMIPFIGWVIGCLGWILVLILSLGGSIMGWIKAFGGERWQIPVISKFSSMLG